MKDRVKKITPIFEADGITLTKEWRKLATRKPIIPELLKKYANRKEKTR